MRMHFSELFDIQGGAIVPRFPINIGGVIMTPGVSFGSGVSFSGIDLSQHTNSDFDVEVQDGVHIIKGIFFEL